MLVKFSDSQLCFVSTNSAIRIFISLKDPLAADAIPVRRKRKQKPTLKFGHDSSMKCFCV